MSSFEPLFTTQHRASAPNRVGTRMPSADAWMPALVSDDTSRMPLVFEPDHATFGAGNDSIAREAEEAAAAAARQAEIDAAYERGLNDGRVHGEQAERTRLRGAVMAAERALEDVRSGESRWLANVEENIAAIAVGVAHQIVTHEVTMASSIVLEIVTRAVQEFGLDQALSIRVNPGDLESMQSAERTESPDMISIARGREVRWLSDARIEPGGCVVEGRERIVDGRVDTGLERMYRRLTHTHA